MIIFGTRSSVVALFVVNFICRSCGIPAAQRVVKRVTKFTLFFVPLFPVSTKHLVSCVNCGAALQLTPEQVEQYRQVVEGGSPVSDSAPTR